MSKYINLYDIHESAFSARQECNNCDSLKGSGVDAVCDQYDNFAHENCPYVEAVINDVDDMLNGKNDQLLIDLIDYSLELEMSKEDMKALNVLGYSMFIINNKELFKQKLTSFFSARVKDSNNYRTVIYV